MSWQAYVDSSLVGSGHVDKAAIISIAADSVWASSAGFTIQPEEMKVILNVLTEQGDAVDQARSNGIYVGGERYIFLNTDDGIIFTRQGRTGVIAAKTKLAIIIAHYGEGQIAGNTATTVGALADFLVKSGY